MNTTQISPLADSHTEEPLWQELTEQEQEKIAGGQKYLPGFQYFNGRRLLRVYKNRCVVLPRWKAFVPSRMPTLWG